MAQLHFLLLFILFMAPHTVYSADSCGSFFVTAPTEALKKVDQTNRDKTSYPIEEAMDISRTEKSAVYVATPRRLQDIIAAINYARMNNLKITMKGTNHTHGGHNRREQDSQGRPQTVQLDMLSYNKILKLDQERNLVTVQPGLTWRDLSVFLNEHGLAAMTEQSSNIFSIGGSVATNIHGRDVHGPLIKSIQEIKFVDADGKERAVSRQQDSDIFKAIIGGYGAFGVMTEITLKVEKNYLYQAQPVHDISVSDYVQYLKNIKTKSRSIMHYGRVNMSGKKPFSKVSFLEWTPISKSSEPRSWNGWEVSLVEKNRWISSFIMNLMRFSPTSNIGKSVKDWTDKFFGFPKDGVHKTKNNILNNPVQFLFDNFYNRDSSVDILQEYFLPLDKLESFLESLRDVTDHHDLNLLNVTMRYVPQIEKNKDSLLSPYSHRADQVAVVLYFNIKESPDLNNGPLVVYDGSAWTQKLIAKAQELGGTFYWPYHRWWRDDQISHDEKNNLKKFFKLKDELDPENIFESDFLFHLRKTF